MRGIALSVLVGCACAIAFTAHRSEAASTSPGKVAVYASTAAAVIDDPAIILTATIQKGKKKRVLEVFASVSRPPTPVESGLLRSVPMVNGLSILQPANAGTTVDGSQDCLLGYRPCQTTMAYWLDLDAAEAAHPGQFIGVPLVITLEAEWQGDSADTPIPVDASLQARLEKK